MTTADRSAELRQLLASRILVWDGAMGTLIQEYGLTEEQFRGERFADHPRDLRGNSELLALTRPHVIREIHERYLEVGADLVITNTLNGTEISQSEYGLEHLAYEINREAARLAAEACAKYTSADPSKPRFVAGSLGPLPKTLSVSTDVDDPGAREVDFERVCAAYAEQVRGLVDGGSDILVVETIFDTLNAK